MTNEQILTKAVTKAQANGYLPNFIVRYDDGMGWTLRGRGTVTVTDSGVSAPVTYMLSEFDIIFDHDFAKALWGEEMVYFDDGSLMGSRPSYEEVGSDSSPYYVPHGENYKYHLQQMVTADDPIKYLGERL